MKVHEYEEGFLVRMMWIFGGGKLWLPREVIKIGSLEGGTLFISRSRILICGMNQVILHGRLADFVENPNEDADADARDSGW